MVGAQIYSTSSDGWGWMTTMKCVADNLYLKIFLYLEIITQVPLGSDHNSLASFHLQEATNKISWQTNDEQNLNRGHRQVRDEESHRY